MEKEEDFKKLFNLFYEYVYKYEVGHPSDFNKDEPLWYCDEADFAELLYETGMSIKVREGY